MFRTLLVAARGGESLDTLATAIPRLPDFDEPLVITPDAVHVHMRAVEMGLDHFDAVVVEFLASLDVAQYDLMWSDIYYACINPVFLHLADEAGAEILKETRRIRSDAPGLVASGVVIRVNNWLEEVVDYLAGKTYEVAISNNRRALLESSMDQRIGDSEFEARDHSFPHYQIKYLKPPAFSVCATSETNRSSLP